MSNNVVICCTCTQTDVGMKKQTKRNDDSAYLYILFLFRSDVEVENFVSFPAFIFAFFHYTFSLVNDSLLSFL